MHRSPYSLVLALILPLAASGCGYSGESCSSSAAAMGDPAATVIKVADEYVDAYYHRFPEEAYESGFPDAPDDRLGDRSVEAMAAWHSREDAWLETLQGVDAAALEGTDAAMPHAFALHWIGTSAAKRVCRLHLWNVSPTWTGWQDILASVFANQPVGAADARAAALARARDVPRYVDTEVANLREGLAQNVTAPRTNVDAVIRLMDGLLEGPTESSPFFDPGTRDDDAGFQAELRGIVENDIRPAIERYRTFLTDEYRGRARETIAATALPDGEACYDAAIRFYTSLPLTPREIHDNGLAQMATIRQEMLEIGRRSFGTDDVRALLQRVSTDPEYTFESREAILEYAQAAVDRAEAATSDWFGFVPQGEVIIRPYADYLKRTGGGFYSAGAVDGSRPGTYELGIYEPRKLPKAGLEATAFHETYPGHHLQVAVGLERAGIHSILRYFFFSGVGEGWALYTERLADEMGLYGSDLDRLGMLSNEALRAARLVVDTGMHAFGWSRQQAIDYLLENTASTEGDAVYEIDRYIAVPAQAVSYMTGSTEIRRLREVAEERMGDGFDIKKFHDLVIGDGTVTLGMLGETIESWIRESTPEG